MRHGTRGSSPPRSASWPTAGSGSAAPWPAPTPRRRTRGCSCSATIPSAPVPVIADAASMEYVLHRRLGDEIVIERPGARAHPPAPRRRPRGQRVPVRADHGRAGLPAAVPRAGGIPRLPARRPAARRGGGRSRGSNRRLADQGFDAATTRDRLAAYHRVENTYLSTFQALGGLGLVLGTVGLATVLLRNALERRREIALLRALGYRPRHVSGMLLAENAALLGLGVGAGLVAALVAVVPGGDAARRRVAAGGDRGGGGGGRSSPGWSRPSSPRAWCGARRCWPR